MAVAKGKKPVRVRRASARSPSLLGLSSSDWYWEQDETFRFTHVQASNPKISEEKLSALLIGKRRWEAHVETKGGWRAHRAILKAHKPFRDLLAWHVAADGSRRCFLVSGEPVHDATGRFCGYRGIGRDISEEQRREDLLRLEHEITLRLSEAASPREAVRATLRSLCETEGWDVGEYWQVNEDEDEARRFQHWARPDLKAARSFSEASEQAVFKPGIGLVGKAWRQDKPLWIPDCSRDKRVLRKDLASRTSLRGALLSPVHYGGRVIGVLSFACRKVRAPDQRLLQSLNVIGRQLGQFLQRTQAEQAMRDSEARFRSLTELSSDWYWEQDAQFRFRLVAGRGASANSRDGKVGNYMGKARWELPGLAPLTGDWDDHRAVLERHQSFREFVLRREYDGKVAYMSISGEPMVDAAGRFAGYRGIGRDVTAQMHAEEELRQFRLAMDSSADMILLVDRGTMRFVDVNSTMCRLLGYSREEFLAKRPEDVLPVSRRELEAAYDAQIANPSMPSGMTSYYLCKDGSRLPFESRRQAIRARGQWLISIVSRDIRERIHAQRAEALRMLEHSVTRAFAETPSASEALTAAIATICRSQGWQCARYLYVDEAAGVLRAGADWGEPEPAIHRYLEESRAMEYAPGAGLVGKVWQSGEPLWVSDISDDPRVARPGLALSTGMHGSYVVPVAAEGRKIGVLIFHSREVRDPDEQLLQTLWVVGTQIGQFLQRSQAAEALRESEGRFRALTQMSSDFFWETDANHRFTQMVHGPNYMAKFGNALIDKMPWELPTKAPDSAGWANLRATFEAHDAFRDFEFARPWPDGTTRYFSVSGEPRFTADGRFLGYRGVGRETTEIALAREHIASLAYSDPLTGLANRTSLGPAFEQAVERARRRSVRLAAMFIDLDGFKPVNDVHGHSAGDRILVEVARRLRASLRASDLVARLGGDEFFLVLEDVQDRTTLEVVAGKILAGLARPYDLAGSGQARISASMGISLYPEDAADAATLMKHADVAMYAAKQSGKNAFRFYKSGDASPAVSPSAVS